MTTPLRLAAAIAGDHTTQFATAKSNAVGLDAELFLRDVKWAKSLDQQATQQRTPSKLSKALRDATTEAASAKSKPSPAYAAQGSGEESQLKQSDDGVGLRTGVIDAVSHFEALLQDASTRVVHNRSRCTEGNTSVLERLKEFDNGFKYRQTVGFTVSRLINETKIETNLDLQHRYGPSIVVPDEQRYLSVLDILRRTGLAGRETDAMRTRIEGNITRPLLPLDDAGIPALLISLNQFTSTDVLATVRAKLQVLAAKIQRLTEQLDGLLHEAQVAKDAEDLARADAIENDVLDVMQAIYDTLVARMELVGASQEADSAGMAAQLDAIMQSEPIDRVRAQNTQLHASALADCDTLDKDRGSRHRSNQQAIANYNAAVQRSYERLERNAYQQELVWDEVVKGLARIEELRRESSDLVTEHLRATETEQKRRKEYLEYQDSYAQHREYVRLLSENTGVAKKFISEVRTFMDDAITKIREMRITEKIAALCAEERKHLDAHYTIFSGRTARRLHALESRASNAARLKTEVDFQVREATTCDDPDKQAHLSRLDTLESAAISLKDRVRAVTDRFDRNQETYTTLMVPFDDFDENANPAVKAIRLRMSLRDQFANALDHLSTTLATTGQELQSKIADHVHKATSAKLMAEKKKAVKASAKSRPAVRPMSGGGNNGGERSADDAPPNDP